MNNENKNDYTLSLHITDIKKGMIKTRLTYKYHGQDEKIIVEKTSTIASAKLMIDGIFKELYLSSGIRVC